LESQFAVVAAVRPNYQTQVEILGVEGRLRRVVRTTNRSPVWGVKWSPGGALLAWGDGQGLHVERADGRNRRLLVAASTSCSHVCVPLTFAWSPDGQRLLVAGAGTQTTRLLLISLKSGHRSELKPAHAYVEYRVIGWSDNSRAIAYTRFSGDPGTASCCQLDLIVDRPDGRRPRNLFSFADGGIHDTPHASWSPDGRFIAFTTEGRDPRDPRLGLVNVERDRIQTFDALDPRQATPAWSPDSTRIALATSHGLVTFSLTNRHVKSLGIAADPVIWRRGLGLLAVAGRQSQDVLRSADGRKPLRLMFHLPKNQSLLVIDAR
jgi:Tol biopolymer transport system component